MLHLGIVFSIDPWNKGAEIETGDGSRISFKDVEKFANPTK